MPKFVTAVACAALLIALAPAARAQQPSHEEDVAAGHKLALTVCSACHVVEANQDMEPVLRPPAPTFASIANRPAETEEAVRTFLVSTHGTLANSKNMPNPMLMDFQVRQAAAYLMSLRTAH